MGDVNAWDVAADGALYTVQCTVYSTVWSYFALCAFVTRKATVSY